MVRVKLDNSNHQRCRITDSGYKDHLSGYKVHLLGYKAHPDGKVVLIAQQEWPNYVGCPSCLHKWGGWRRWCFLLSYNVVLFSTGTFFLADFQQKYRVVLLLRRSGSITPNGQNMLCNLDHQITLHCVCYLNFSFIYFECLNQYHGYKRDRQWLTLEFFFFF